MDEYCRSRSVTYLYIICTITYLYIICTVTQYSSLVVALHALQCSALSSSAHHPPLRHHLRMSSQGGSKQYMHRVTIQEAIASQGIPWLIGIDMELVNTCRVSFTLHVVHAQLTPLCMTIMLPSLTSGSSGSLYLAHVQGSSAGGSRLNSSRRHSRRRITYALSPLEIIMQCPPVVECDDVQPPLALPPVFSEEDMASISSLKSRKARRARRLAISKRMLQDQLHADAAMALQLNNSWNLARR